MYTYIFHVEAPESLSFLFFLGEYFPKYLICWSPAATWGRSEAGCDVTTAPLEPEWKRNEWRRLGRWYRLTPLEEWKLFQLSVSSVFLAPCRPSVTVRCFHSRLSASLLGLTNGPFFLFSSCCWKRFSILSVFLVAAAYWLLSPRRYMA